MINDLSVKQEVKENPVLFLDALIQLMRDINPESLECMDGELVSDKVENYKEFMYICEKRLKDKFN